jgi:soluble cytochrome b562
MTATQSRNQVLEAAQVVRDSAADAAHSASRAAETVADQAPGVVRAFRAGMDDLADRLPGAAAAVQAGAIVTTDSLRTMPEPSLRLLAAVSVGMGLGLYAAGAPRVVTLVAFTPAVLAAVALGFNEPGGRKPKH